MGSDIATNLADNIRQLRESRRSTQEQMARLSGVPRPTWASLESGSANPTVAVLVRVAGALQISIEELIGPPRATGRLYKASTLPIRKRGTARVRRLLPEPIPGMEIDRLDLPAGGILHGVPHLHGTREFLTCEQGSIELIASGEHFVLEEGDVVAFRGDQRHSYRNPGSCRAVAYSVVALAPAGR